MCFFLGTANHADVVREDSTAHEGSDAPRASPADLQLLTRTLVEVSVRRAIVSRRDRRAFRTTWHEQIGALPFDALLLIDDEVRAAPLRQQNKRSLTFEKKLIATRKQLDAERRRAGGGTGGGGRRRRARGDARLPPAGGGASRRPLQGSGC